MTNNHVWTGPTKAAEGMNPDLRWENPALLNISYNPDNGEFRWIKIPRGARRDGVCGTIHTDRRGYRSRIISSGGYSYKAHRIAWFKVYGLPIPKEIDHVDGDGTNNAIKNLRASDSSKNKRNRHMQSNNVSGFTGLRALGMRKCSYRFLPSGLARCVFRRFKYTHNGLMCERLYSYMVSRPYNLTNKRIQPTPLQKRPKLIFSGLGFPISQPPQPVWVHIILFILSSGDL